MQGNQFTLLFCLGVSVFFLLQHQTPQVTVAPSSGTPRYDWGTLSARPQAGHWELGMQRYAGHSPCPPGAQPRPAHMGVRAAGTPRPSTPTLWRCPALDCRRSPLIGLPNPSLPPAASLQMVDQTTWLSCSKHSTDPDGKPALAVGSPGATARPLKIIDGRTACPPGILGAMWYQGQL